MRIKYLTWLSALALVMLVVAQYFFITETFETKKEQIDGKYGTLVQKGIYEFEEQYFGYSRDSLFSALDNQALQFLRAGKNRDSLVENFNLHLNKYNDLNHFLRNYLMQHGEDPVFHSAYIIRSLTLIDISGEHIVFIEPSLKAPAGLKDPILAGSFALERNYFRTTYDYYISIVHKTGMIMREMRMTLFLAVITILIVFIVYYMTLKNMLRQKRLSDLKTDFINNMTHELKTPLSTISVASSSLANPDLNIKQERIKELSALIKKQNKHLSDLIDRILDIAIWEKDQVKLQKKKVALEPFIREIIEAFRLEYGEDKSDIQLQIHPGNKTVFIDDIHMTTVINNLLLNSLKYAVKKPEIVIDVRSNGELLISVSDNGPGIPKEEQKNVFQKFYRGNDSKRRAIKGLGLGLYYVNQIVKAHNGDITLESEPGKGVTFIIKIPLDHEHITG
ncbi:MAG: HAMP domain-containing histidine kinase [Bacteroidales bacterium]|nr:HAMP domain-containing histidine kinase [Bacteroidales bacterium]MBN2698578.1 HAMP domain-containing histidine kinase [Bacteroidales bacterium]